MDKVHMLNTLITLHQELSKRMEDEVHTANDQGKISEYKRQLQQIQNEIDRINRGRAYSR